MPIHPSVPADMPAPTGEAGYRVLNAVWKWFKSNNEWPTFDQIDRQLYRSEGTRFLEEAVSEVPEGLIRGIDLRRIESAVPGHTVQLTLAGAANCDDSGTEITALMGLVRLGANIERDWEPPRTQNQPVQPHMDTDVLRLHAFDPSLLPSLEVLYRAALLAINEPWSNGLGRRQDDLYWQLSFDRRIRPFANVTELADYWDKRVRVMAPETVISGGNSIVSSSLEAVAVGTAYNASIEIGPSQVERLASLHEDVDAIAGDLFRDGYMKQAVFEMCKHLEHRVQQLVDPDSSGKQLMGKAFNSRPPALDPTRAIDPFTRSAEQEGFGHLFMGMMQAIRNPGGHGNYPLHSEEEAFELLAFLSFLSRRLDLAQQGMTAAEADSLDTGNS